MPQNHESNDEMTGGVAETREAALQRIMNKPLWSARDLSVVLDRKVDSVLHMKARNEIPGVVQINLRTWFVVRDVFLEELKQRASPRPGRGRPPAVSR